MTSLRSTALPPVAAEGAIVVFGATGGVGRHAVEQLLGAGQEVIAVVRDAAKGTPLAKAGARVVIHDLQHDDSGRLSRHLTGAESVLFCGRCALRSAARRTGRGRSWRRCRRRGRGAGSRCRPVRACVSHRSGQRTAARIRRRLVDVLLRSKARCKRDGTNKRPAVDRHPARGTHRPPPNGSCQPE
jgi:hypothetical protein